MYKRQVITYTAELNQNAEIGTRVGNPNEVYLEYSNNPNAGGTGKTEEDYVCLLYTSWRGQKKHFKNEKLPSTKQVRLL